MATDYDSWEEAFDSCREGDAPEVVRVDGEVAKIFPSGTCKILSRPDPLDAALEATDGDIDLVES